MALNESLNRFKQQQERCLSSMAASQARPQQLSKPAVTNAPSANKPPVRLFSEDTERLQRMNSVSKSPVGAQIKLVVDLLYKKREAFTAKQINEETHVAIEGPHSAALLESLRNNPKVQFDGRRFSYKPKHNVKGKHDLLQLITSFPDGLPVAEVEDAYLSVLQDLQALKDPGDIYWLSGQQDMVYKNDPRMRMKVDKEFKELFHEMKLPRDMLDIEKELRRNGDRPATDTVKRRAAAQANAARSMKLRKKKTKQPRGITGRTKLTNAHLPELFDLPVDLVVMVWMLPYVISTNVLNWSSS
ncbi:transcription initiation factor IIE subunit beta [Brachypodium distachyon]|uniref:transcription initiation factor IIE subunit beta n=1 Tax=Brachypodium distachyon TaxID=15368 RepID=UPI0006E47E11|nr:transcription initiation factor IIE subunit beta [Brachypodium distachyon]|eukprot:XP_014752429.1 transcription initiation factor IIE subunit beta [Brachypodium distachyon]